MANSSRLDRVYAQLLCNHPYGWALFKKVTTKDIFPGVCGFFDTDGDWHPLVNLNDPSSLADSNMTVPGTGIGKRREPESMVWGPKQSGSTSSNSIGSTVGTSLVVAPVEASVTVSFESSDDKGAVLITESPVWKNQIGDEREALQWMAENTDVMLRRYGDIIKRHGIWIVAKTYSTRRCAIAVMTSQASAVEIGLGADVQGLLTLKPESRWTKNTGSSCTELHEDGSGVVAFMSGIYFSQKPLRSKLRHTRDQHQQRNKIFRGEEGQGDENILDVDGDVELHVQHYPPLAER
ncbi:hypothetical protein CEP54_009804 [Fusarium duplospermum]|uniref:Uncharacterized protein n=1 Tax=Fusarium duplospermum TaxID=1325734 RepID=A0A428PNL6_9HYPO|nr:hypothetical protein CEP54_009804 [Fusarium duplospermum]